MFVGLRLKAEKFGDAPVEFADGIRVEDFLFENKPIPFPAPLGAATQIAFTIEGDDDGVLEWRRQVSRCGVGCVVVDRNYTRFREHAQCDRQG
jgi:hypothetical protein